MTTSKPARPAFQAVEIDGIDERLEAQAAEKGIPTLVTPKADVAATAEPGIATAHAVIAKGTTKTGRAGGPAAATPRGRMKTLNVEVPDYAWIEIKMRAAREMVSVRHVIMAALQANGIAINDADMIEDGRRLRGDHA